MFHARNSSEGNTSGACVPGAHQHADVVSLVQSLAHDLTSKRASASDYHDGGLGNWAASGSLSAHADEATSCTQSYNIQLVK
eukprot:351893-Chlamydomonas_euryale.AAC.26